MLDLRAVVTGRPLFSTTGRGVEFAIMAVSVGARGMLLLQMSAAVVTGVRASPRPPLYAAFFALAAGWSVIYIVLVIRARSASHPWFARIDISVACVCLATQPFVVQPGQNYDSWINWGYVFALNMLSASGCNRIRRSELVVGVLAVATLYLTTRLAGTDVEDSAVVSNAVSLFVFPLLTGAFGSYLRRLGADADQARADAAAVAQQAERERHQLLLHDSATILRLIAAGELPAELTSAIRRQAADESNRIRRFLDGAETPPTAGPDRARLTDLVQQSVDSFSDLPIDVVVDLATGVRLTPARAAAVRLALSGLLSNVRVHAHATQVVVHGDWDPEESEWELVIRDDGVGFDPAVTPDGFGLDVQVRKSLAAHDITTLIQSAPGQGTVAVLRGAADGTPSDGGGPR